MQPNDRAAHDAADPLWYKDAIVYELHVRAFADSNDDGMGDFRGLTQKLDHLQDLGVTAIWLLPFSPSPWRDDGYDISDYTGIHPAYGTLRDFQAFLREAHKRGLRVITEIVVNHTSDQHPWFQRARRAAPGSKWRDFYVWSDTPEKYRNARIIFKDFETSNWAWDPIAKAYYWHRFYSHQPDLNFDNPAVREAVKEVAGFWMDMGVDGFRLDAIPYLYEREETNCENLPETHEYLKELRAYVESKYPDRLLLAEANQWPEDAISYFGNGDECQMAFHFPLMPRLFMATRMEDRYPILDILGQTPPIPDNCQWAIFLRNHDELTLEMVTDDERDYMYRVYAHERQMRINLGIRRRLAPLLGNDRRKIELMNGLLLSMPGTPVLYYGDEIGMGDNIYLGDRNGVRTPMQWSADRNAGFSRANPQKLYLPIIIDPEYHYEAVNVEGQQTNPNSLLWWMKRLIEQRKKHRPFGRGSIEFLNPSNRRVLAFYRRLDDENILVVANLSRFPQHAELDLSAFKAYTLVEMFGRAEFPPIGDLPYLVTLPGHSFYWFSVENRAAHSESIVFQPPEERPVLEVTSFDDFFAGNTLARLTAMLPEFLRTRRWFLGKNRSILKTEIADMIRMPDTDGYLGLMRVEYGDADPETYVVQGGVATGEEGKRLLGDQPGAVMARLRSADGREGVLYSAVNNPKFCDALLGVIARRRRLRGAAGELLGSHTRAFRTVWGARHPVLAPSVYAGEQRNTTVVYGDRFVLKLFRRVEPGVNPEIEMLAFLTARRFPNAPTLTGALEYRADEGDAMSLGILTSFIPNQGDAWQYTIDALSRFFEHALAGPGRDPSFFERRHPMLLMNTPIPDEVHALFGEYPENARRLGQCTGELHATLASDGGSPEFAPEPFTDHYRQGLYHGMLGVANRAFAQLRQQLGALGPDVQNEARNLLAREDQVRARLRTIRDRRLNTSRLRIHGDYNLGQVLYTGRDFAIIDFEGIPARPYTERRIKRSPLRDVTGMLRSLQYAAYAVLFGRVPGVTTRPEAAGALEAWAAFWWSRVSAIFLEGYLGAAGRSGFLPADVEELRILLDAYMLDKALRELQIELSYRPDWAMIPLRGIAGILET